MTVFNIAFCNIAKRYHIRMLTLAGLIAVSSCTLGPDFKRPSSAEDVKDYTAHAEAEQALSTLALGKELPGEWWTLFHSKPLTALIEQALKNNPDLQSAQATLIQAQEIVRSTQGSLLPALDASGYGTRQQVSGAQFGSPGHAGSIFSLYNTSVNVSYTLDVFGAIRRQIESLDAQAEYQRFQLEGTFLTIASNIVTTAIQDASIRAQIAALIDIINAQTQQLDIIKQQVELGSASKMAILTQQSTLEQTKTNLPPLQQQLAQLHNRLKVLVGNFPSSDLAAQFELDDLQLPTNLPLSLPSQLVEQRPDIRAQEALLHASSAQIGVVIASAFPNFTLRANVASLATQTSNMFTPGSEIWNMTSSLAQPLFHGGQLTHQREAAKASYQQLAAQYRSTVLQAFENVADTLNALHYDAEELQTQQANEYVSKDTLALTEAQQKIGTISYLELLIAQRNYQQARIGQIKAKAAQLADTAALFQALGGGWWKRADLSKKLINQFPPKPKSISPIEQFRQFITGQ